MNFARALELCRLAEVLANDANGAPRFVARNRAVSTAYYGLFHAVAEFCARELVGAWKPYLAFRHVYRSLDHGAVRSALGGFDRDRSPSARLRRFAAFFNALQDMRHDADYDPDYRVAYAELISLVADTRHQIKALDELESDEKRLFAARLIGKTRNQSQKPRAPVPPEKR